MYIYIYIYIYIFAARGSARRPRPRERAGRGKTRACRRPRLAPRLARSALEDRFPVQFGKSACSHLEDPIGSLARTGRGKTRACRRPRLAPERSRGLACQARREAVDVVALDRADGHRVVGGGPPGDPHGVGAVELLHPPVRLVLEVAPGREPLGLPRPEGHAVPQRVLPALPLEGLRPRGYPRLPAELQALVPRDVGVLRLI